MNQQKLIEVLNPQPLTAYRCIKPATVIDDSLVEQVIEDGAAELRAAYIAGINASITRDKSGSFRFNNESMDTYLAYHEMTERVADDRLLSLVNAVFHRAGLLREELKPTFASCKAEMQRIALEAATVAHNFLAQQASFNLGE